jgi:hypothetical protein
MSSEGWGLKDVTPEAWRGDAVNQPEIPAGIERYKKAPPLRAAPSQKEACVKNGSVSG